MASQKRTNTTPLVCDDATWAFMHALPDAAILIDTDVIICAVNEAAAKNLKTNVADLTGTSLYDASPPNIASEQKRRIDEVISQESPSSLNGCAMENTLTTRFIRSPTTMVERRSRASWW